MLTVARGWASNLIYTRFLIFPLILEDHQGPVSTYMASCDGDCTGFSANNAKWFKLDAGGYDPETKQWAADQLRASWVSHSMRRSTRNFH